jgi:hypothetical protein
MPLNVTDGRANLIFNLRSLANTCSLGLPKLGQVNDMTPVLVNKKL